MKKIFKLETLVTLLVTSFIITAIYIAACDYKNRPITIEDEYLDKAKKSILECQDAIMSNDFEKLHQCYPETKNMNIRYWGDKHSIEDHCKFMFERIKNNENVDYKVSGDSLFFWDGEGCFLFSIKDVRSSDCPKIINTKRIIDCGLPRDYQHANHIPQFGGGLIIGSMNAKYHGVGWDVQDNLIKTTLTWKVLQKFMEVTQKDMSKVMHIQCKRNGEHTILIERELLINVDCFPLIFNYAEVTLYKNNEQYGGIQYIKIPEGHDFFRSRSGSPKRSSLVLSGVEFVDCDQFTVNFVHPYNLGILMSSVGRKFGDYDAFVERMDTFGEMGCQKFILLAAKTIEENKEIFGHIDVDKSVVSQSAIDINAWPKELR